MGNRDVFINVARAEEDKGNEKVMKNYINKYFPLNEIAAAFQKHSR